ncbi:unnamed protein product [Sphagnum balticum]
MKSNNNVDAPIAPNLVDKDDLDAGDKEGDAASSLGRGVMSAGKSALKTGGKFAGELAGEVPDILKFGGELAGPLGIAASLLIPDAKMNKMEIAQN